MINLEKSLEFVRSLISLVVFAIAVVILLTAATYPVVFPSQKLGSLSPDEFDRVRHLGNWFLTIFVILNMDNIWTFLTRQIRDVTFRKY